jgi:hypothetical protein
MLLSALGKAVHDRRPEFFLVMARDAKQLRIVKFAEDYMDRHRDDTLRPWHRSMPALSETEVVLREPSDAERVDENHESYSFGLSAT